MPKQREIFEMLNLAIGGYLFPLSVTPIKHVVLYREFVKRAKVLHGWLVDTFKLDGAQCEPAVASSAGVGVHGVQVAALTELAECFEVCVVGLRREL